MIIRVDVDADPSFYTEPSTKLLHGALLIGLSEFSPWSVQIEAELLPFVGIMSAFKCGLFVCLSCVSFDVW